MLTLGNSKLNSPETGQSPEYSNLESKFVSCGAPQATKYGVHSELQAATREVLLQEDLPSSFIV